MGTWKDAVIVTLIAIGASVLVGFLGFLADKSGEPEGRAEDRAELSPRKGAVSK